MSQTTTIGLAKGNCWRGLTSKERIAFLFTVEDIADIFNKEIPAPPVIAKKITEIYLVEPANLRIPIVSIKSAALDVLKGQTAAAQDYLLTMRKVFNP